MKILRAFHCILKNAPFSRQKLFADTLTWCGTPRRCAQQTRLTGSHHEAKAGDHRDLGQAFPSVLGQQRHIARPGKRDDGALDLDGPGACGCQSSNQPRVGQRFRFVAQYGVAGFASVGRQRLFDRCLAQWSRRQWRYLAGASCAVRPPGGHAHGHAVGQALCIAPGRSTQHHQAGQLARLPLSFYLRPV